MARVFIAMPVYKEVHPATRFSLEQLLKNCGDHTIELARIYNNPNIDIARAYLLGKYLQSTYRMDYFLQIDSDVKFAPGVLDILIERKLPAVGGIYTYKSGKESEKSGLPVLRAYTGAVVRRDGLLRARYLPGGFLLLDNNVIHELIKQNPQERIHLHPSQTPEDDEEFLETYHFWQGLRVPNRQWGKGIYEYLSDDFALSYRITRAGFELFADTTVKILHCEGGNAYEVGEGQIR